MISVNSVSRKHRNCRDTDIPRKTFYNNELLAKFVEENATVDSVSREETKKLRSRLDDAEDRLLKMMHRDLETEMLRYQITKLQAELETSHNRIKALEEQHEQDLRRMNKSVITPKRTYDA